MGQPRYTKLMKIPPEIAADNHRHKRQLVSAFVLRPGRVYHPTKPPIKSGRCDIANGCNARTSIIRRIRSPFKRCCRLSIMPRNAWAG